MNKSTSGTGVPRKGRAAKRAVHPKDTRQRIVDRSIVLFNRHGLRNMSTDRIAADLKISAGNLTYHFPRKKDLIAATLEVMKKRLQAALAFPQNVRSPDDGAAFLVRLYHEMWNFRFFFNALTYVLTDRDVSKAYSDLREWALGEMVGDCEVMAEQGLFVTPKEPNNYRLICINLWSLLLNWLRMQHIETPVASIPDNDATFDCAFQQWSLFEPIMRGDFSTNLLRAFRRALPPGEKRPAIPPM